MASIEDSVWNSALLKTAQRFTDESSIQTLGIKVLKIRQHEVDSVWNKHKPDTNLTAHDLLKKFARRHESRIAAFKELTDGLCKNDWNELSKLFREWTEGTEYQEDPCQKSTFKIYTSNTLQRALNYQ